MSPDLILEADHLRLLLTTLRPELDDRLARFHYTHMDEQIVTAFELFIVFYDCPFEEVPTGRNSERVQAANTYFWFAVYHHLHRIRFGENDGLDQQAFNIWAQAADTIGDLETESIARVIESTVHSCRVDATRDIIETAADFGR